ncbi:MAG TPA: triose-phosphate isomerase [Crocinitomix sp.]|nr:triose-phosphate isomerase [Crocinitomix sp.]
MRKKIIAGNWKMNLDYSESKSLIQNIAKIESDFNANAEIVIFPSMPYLSVFHELTKDIDWINIGSQNCYFEKSGAFTGETSPVQLKSLGIKYCLVGHSERRDYFSEDNVVLAKKIKALLEEGITPIFCCGEQLQVREANVYKEFIMKQVEESLFDLSVQDIARVVIAYEPVWAIGTGKTATAQQAQEIHQLIRNRIAKDFGDKTANEMSILYGGSMKAENARELLAQKDIDGGLIGGASLNADTFAQISISYSE